ncbi:ribosome biogenesis protein 15 [[Candida] anglica]|uniref:Ribosome biogenesis protein 15 n=1 Tax=[Candida] anglica TaxID=148631 RepID=A0ABP0ED36_9ASCO
MAKQNKATKQAGKQAKPEKASEKSVEEIEADLQLPSSSDEELSAEEAGSDEDLSEDSEDEDVSDESSVEVEIEGEEAPQQETADATTIPQITHKVTKAKQTVTTSKQNKSRGVIYLGRIPHGFHEVEMNKYFAQFGDITRLRLSRNKKTGKSKHYGFIEFAEHAVAVIAAETMNNYLLFGHLLKCHVVPKEDVHDDLFKGSATTYKAVPWAKISKVKHDSPKSKIQWERLSKKHEQSKKTKADKLKAKGIDFDLSSIV